jgi:aminoglycoside phosphotransferase (APT) family kinase protein
MSSPNQWPAEDVAIDGNDRGLMLRVMIDAVFSSHHDHSAMVREGPPPAAVHWALRAVDPNGRILAVEPLHGGISHANHAIRIETGGAVREVVLRRWVRACPQEEDTGFSAAQEAATYGLLAASAVPAPRLLAADLDARECDVPALLLSRAPGTAPTAPDDGGGFLGQLAAALPAIHAVDPERAARTVPPYRPYYRADELRVPAWTRAPSAWERAIELAAAALPAGPAAFIHRDYHPGNTLWVAGRLTAIVDWTSASWGPPAVDVAHMRANLAMSFGIEATDGFLAAYRTVAGPYAHDPYWDLRIAVDFLPELRLQARPEFDRLDDFVTRAAAAL